MNQKWNAFKLKGHVGWDNRIPWNENYLNFEFSSSQFSYHQTRSNAQFLGGLDFEAW